MLPNTPATALFVLTQTKMKNFDEADWQTWSGCNSETPMIGEIKFNGEDIIVILDGSEIGFYNEDGDYEIFTLEDALT